MHCSIIWLLCIEHLKHSVDENVTIAIKDGTRGLSMCHKNRRKPAQHLRFFFWWHIRPLEKKCVELLFVLLWFLMV